MTIPPEQFELSGERGWRGVFRAGDAVHRKKDLGQDNLFPPAIGIVQGTRRNQTSVCVRWHKGFATWELATDLVPKE